MVGAPRFELLSCPWLFSGRPDASTAFAMNAFLEQALQVLQDFIGDFTVLTMKVDALSDRVLTHPHGLKSCFQRADRIPRFRFVSECFGAARFDNCTYSKLFRFQFSILDRLINLPTTDSGLPAESGY